MKSTQQVSLELKQLNEETITSRVANNRKEE